MVGSFARLILILPAGEHARPKDRVRPFGHPLTLTGATVGALVEECAHVRLQTLGDSWPDGGA
eukprot:20019-Pyramimonas_sp.AAC.1